MSLTSISGGLAASVQENAKTEQTKSIGQQRATPRTDEATASKGLPAPMSHANRVGVAAYLSVMNPVPAASMHTEA